MVRKLIRSFALMAIVLPVGIATASGGTTFAGVSLSVSKEQAPPDGMAQVKVFMTEPKPISTGGGSLTFAAYDALVGIAVFSPASDTFGIALVRGTSMNFSLISPAATFGTTIDYPILTIVGHVPASTPLGTKFPLTIDPAALTLYDSTGTLYPVEVKQGHLVTGSGVAISDVNPGSATVPIGGIVTITGTNFDPRTTIKFGEARIAQIRYISSTRIDVVLAQTANMHGMMIKAGNPDGSSQTYFSYQRTRAMSPSIDPVMQYATPLLPPVAVTTETIALPPPAPSTTYGIAVQNIDTTDATVTVDLLDAAGNVAATTTLFVSPNRFIVRELSELFGVLADPAAAIRVTSTTPVEVVGVAADQNAGTASPIH